MKSKFHKWRKKTKRAVLGNRRRKVRSAVAIAGVVAVVAAIIFFIWVLRIEKLQISDIVISGNTVVGEERIKNIVDSNIEGMYFWILAPKSNILLYSKSKIKEDIYKAFPRINKVSVSFINLHSIKVEVDERRGVAQWCGEHHVEDTPGENCYFLDEEGIIFAESPHFSGNIFFKYLGSISTSSTVYDIEPFGHSFVDEVAFKKMQVFIDVLIEDEFVPIRLVKVDDNDFEMWFEEGWYIIFKQSEKVEVLLDSLQSVLASGALRDEGKMNQLKYIDFRFGNRVYYKFDEPSI